MSAIASAREHLQEYGLHNGDRMTRGISPSLRGDADLHAKREDYARYGVREYLVLSLREKKLHWFDLQKDRELKIDADGICRVRTFPGLWIHVAALLDRNHKRLMRTLKKGLASPDHAAFVAKLASAQRKPRKRK